MVEGKEWARSVLAAVEVWIDKHREGLGEGYEGVRRGLSMGMGKGILGSSSPMHEALDRELWRCYFYRGEVPFSVVVLEVERFAGRVVPAEYEVIMGLPALSARSWKQWHEPLWVLVKLHNPGLQGELAKRYGRATRRLSQYRTEFRRRVERIAEAI